MPPAYVKPYVRRQKNDMADAAAICEAVSRPSMRYVLVKSTAQQAARPRIASFTAIARLTLFWRID